jgi:nucleoside-diphosphate-sugar epimerase
VTRILVTGAGGFLGGALARRLGARDDVALTLCARIADPAAGLVGLDLHDKAAVAAVLREARPDVVVHAAGRTPGRPGALFADNAVATANLAEAIGTAAAGAGLIVLGSAAQYGISETQTPWRESDLCAPFEPYGISKHVAETCAMAAARRYGFRATALRLFNVISAEPRGEQVFAAFLRKAAAAAAAGPPPWRVRMGPLIALRDFVHLDDVLTAVERVIEREAWGETLNVCAGVGRTARALVGAATAQTGGALIVEEEAPAGVLELPWSVGDPSRCEARLGFRPSVDLAPIARRAAAWLMARAKGGADARSDA